MPYGQIVLAPKPFSALEEALTPREREVIELVGQSLPNKLIARKLQISEHTGKFHLSSVSTWPWGRESYGRRAPGADHNLNIVRSSFLY